MNNTMEDTLYSTRQDLFPLLPPSLPPSLPPLQERSLERLPPLSPNIACQFVRLVELLLGSPPRLDCLRYVCDHLLVSDVNDLKLVTGPAMLETSVSVFDGKWEEHVHTCADTTLALGCITSTAPDYLSSTSTSLFCLFAVIMYVCPSYMYV